MQSKGPTHVHAKLRTPAERATKCKSCNPRNAEPTACTCFQTHLGSGGPRGRYASQQNVVEQELQLRGEAVPAHIKQGVGEAQGP
jgi:hypothetical protein